MSDQKIVSILTGNSNTGAACIHELFRSSTKFTVRGAFRSEEKAKPFRDQYPQMQVVTGVDASKPETMVDVFKGAHAAYIVTPLDHSRGFADDAKLTENMINSAVENGVKYVVVCASWTVIDPVRCGAIASRFVSTEALLSKLEKEKKVRFTCLRGGCFMMNVNANNAVSKSVKAESVARALDITAALVDERDIGKCAAVLLTRDGHGYEGKFVEMTGPEYIDGAKIGQTLTKVLGREIKFQSLPPEVVFAHMPKGVADLFKYMVEEGEKAAPKTDDVKHITGQHGTFEQYIRDHIKDYQ